MLQLPEVTLVLVDTQCQQLACMALDDTLARAQFAKVIVATDRPELFRELPEVAVVTVAGWADKDERERFIWYELSKQVATSHWLRMQWDGWVIDPGFWSKRFLDYDYVGAPWLWHDDNYQVGNGGFALHSRRLSDFLRANSDRLPLANPSDHLICRAYRELLEDNGFSWAPLHVAERFAFEGGPDGRHWEVAPLALGFHGVWNFKHVLSPEQLRQRALWATPYALDKAKQFGGDEFIACYTEQFGH